MENSKANNSSNKLKVVEMLRIDAGVRVDLKGVVVVSRVFEQAVEWIKHLMRKQEEELSAGNVSDRKARGRQKDNEAHLDNPP